MYNITTLSQRCHIFVGRRVVLAVFGHSRTSPIFSNLVKLILTEGIAAAHADGYRNIYAPRRVARSAPTPTARVLASEMMTDNLYAHVCTPRRSRTATRGHCLGRRGWAMTRWDHPSFGGRRGTGCNMNCSIASVSIPEGSNYREEQ